MVRLKADMMMEVDQRYKEVSSFKFEPNWVQEILIKQKVRYKLGYHSVAFSHLRYCLYYDEKLKQIGEYTVDLKKGSHQFLRVDQMNSDDRRRIQKIESAIG